MCVFVVGSGAARLAWRAGACLVYNSGCFFVCDAPWSQQGDSFCTK